MENLGNFFEMATKNTCERILKVNDEINICKCFCL